ncbi:neocarzinostatin apoprotein domain-containing protein [Populibacterium corticicola]|uniref:Neocarzinostatin apoprotein domain-containing protein n=1 Tax=Populibacterium corticicola TaxID=1812826 RepID=A0ABW5XGR5_9MICO
MQVSNVTKTRRRAGAIALTSMLSAAALVAGTISAAHATGTLDVDPTTGVVDGGSVEVSGTGYTQNVNGDVQLRVALCDLDEYLNSGVVLCDTTNAEIVDLDSNGDFSDLELNVDQVFTGFHYGTSTIETVTCAGSVPVTGDSQCAVFTSQYGAGYLNISYEPITFN